MVYGYRKLFGSLFHLYYEIKWMIFIISINISNVRSTVNKSGLLRFSGTTCLLILSFQMHHRQIKAFIYFCQLFAGQIHMCIYAGSIPDAHVYLCWKYSRCTCDNWPGCHTCINRTWHFEYARHVSQWVPYHKWYWITTTWSKWW